MQTVVDLIFFFAISVIIASKTEEKMSKLKPGLVEKVEARSGSMHTGLCVLHRFRWHHRPWRGPPKQGDVLSKGTLRNN